jgi:flagellar export protein FliJ
MQSFRFSLERVLNWRRTELRAEEARLAPMMAESGRLDEARRQIVGAHERAQSDLLAAGRVDGSELEALSRYRARLEKERTTVERQMAQCLENIARQRVRIVEAHRRARLLEKLRERRFEDWRKAGDVEMENFASEAFLARWQARD